jgi:3-deoxy-D-manno-octulosonic-acid transferase
MGPAMRHLYNLLFAGFLLLSAPRYFLKLLRRGGWRDGFGQRFGRYDAKIKQAVTNSEVWWLHAVSVGEVGICTQLIRALEPRLPHAKIMVSTTTSTGMQQLRDHLPSHILKIYYPIDRERYVERALRVLRPRTIILVEAEIWPNFLWHARRKEIPLFLVNARLSERSARGYRRFAFLFRPLFAGFSGVGAQTPADAERLIELGCRPEAVHIVGSLKFDSARLDERRLIDVPAVFRQLGWPADALILVAGSTHAGEEIILAEQFRRLRARFPKLYLVLVPRHFERGKEVGQQLESRGLKFVYRSQVTQQSQYAPGQIDCLLVNTTGELKYFYEHAAVIFVGKSLSAMGGQNPIEPGCLGKAMLFGPHMENFAAIAQAFVSANAAIQVPDAAALEEATASLLADAGRREELGAHALRVVQENRGAVERTVEMILKELGIEKGLAS